MLGLPPSGMPVEKDVWETPTLIFSADPALASAAVLLLGQQGPLPPDEIEQVADGGEVVLQRGD